MEYDEHGGCWIANSPDDFRGWEYLGNKHWKTDKDDKEIYTVYVRTPLTHGPSFEMRTVFCEEKNLPEIKNGMCI